MTVISHHYTQNIKFAEEVQTVSDKECSAESLVFGNIWFMKDDARCLCGIWASCLQSAD